MNVPSWLDLGKLAQIVAMTLLIVQYLKTVIPVKYIKIATILVGVGVAFLFQMELSPYVKMIIYGIFAAVGADGGYDFFSGNKSPSYTFSSITQKAGNQTTVEEKKP